MRILMCCADWGVPLFGNAGSSVHFRSLARALAGLGHEVRLVVSNAQGSAGFDLPVASVPFRRMWPGLHARIERLRGRRDSGDTAQPAPPAASGDATAQAAVPSQDDSPEGLSWKLRLYYHHLPRLMDRGEELFVHPFSFARAVAGEIEAFRPHALYERYALGQFGAALAAGSLSLMPFRPFAHARSARAAKGAPVPHFLEVNASLAAERRDMAGPWSWWGRQTEKRIWRAPKRLFCVSERLGALAAEAGVDPGLVRITPNGVDVDAFSPERPKGALRGLLGAGAGEVLVGWLGALSPGRGAEEFVRIMALVARERPSARGVVIGGGPLEGECRNLAARLGVSDRMSFLGPVDHARVPLLLADLDVAVACYPKQEAFYFSPMKLGEYLACGLAVVAGRAGQMKRMVEDGVNGVLVEPGDLPGWAGAIAGLCVDRARRGALGRAARLSALSGPTWEKNARTVEREMLECGGSGEMRP